MEPDLNGIQENYMESLYTLVDEIGQALDFGDLNYVEVLSKKLVLELSRKDEYGIY